VLVRKPVAPPYTAVIECVRRLKPDVLRVACREEFSLADPRVVVPSMNVTVPVGVPAVALTVAVKVTLWPLFEGLRDDVSVVVVLALTVCVRDDDVLVRKFVSPLYTAVIL